MAVFDGVQYSLSPSLSPTRRNELAAILDLNGASPHSPYTHLIALPASHAHTDSDATSTCLKIVTDRWVDRSVVMGKRQPEQYYSPDPAMIFSGVVACATDLSPPDLEVLSAGITALGGQWRIGLTRDVTHLFALRPGSDKYNTALHFASQTHMCVLTPHWFDDAVRLGRRIPETPYTWPDPPILRPGMTLNLSDEPLATDGRRKRKSAGDTAGAADAEGGHIPVWAGRRILLSTSLELSGGSRSAIETGIQRAGGVVVPIPEDATEDVEEKAVNECDVFITRWRSGKPYFKAARASLLVGTLSWLFSVESSGTLHSPLDSLLWYPTPRGGIPGLIDYEISITNYTGAARDYLKRLIVLVGARFTPSMSQSNKILLAGFQPSPKTTRALSWSIPVVNHTWLEDCFVEWRALTVGLERYIVYPPGIDFGKMLMTQQDGLPSSQSSTPRSTGGAVPGGRGIGIIDVEREETRDAEYRDHADKPGDPAGSLMTHEADTTDLTGDLTRLEDDIPMEPRAGPRLRAELVKKTPPPRLWSVSTPLTASATGAFVDHVVEIPEDGEDVHKDTGGKRPTKATGKQRERASSIVSRMRSRSISRPPATDSSLPPKEIEVVSDSRGRSKVRKGKEKDDTGRRQTRHNEEEDKDTSRSARRSTSKPRLVMRTADNQTDTVALQQALAKASKATRRPGKGIATDSDTHSVAGDASDASVPPRRATAVGSMTPVKSGMKPRPRSKSISKAGSVGEESENEMGMVDFEAETGEQRDTSNPRSENDILQERGKRDKDGKKETDKVASGGPDTKNMRRQKRRLSVLVPSVPDGYFSSQSIHDTEDGKDEDDRERDTRKGAASVKSTTRQPLVPTASLHAVAGEASSSANKRSKPSPAKVSVTLPTGKSKPSIKAKGKAKAKVVTGKEATTARASKTDDDMERVEDSDMSLIVGATPISRGGPRRSAANKATTRLREEIMPDVINYEKEQKQAKRRRSAGGESTASIVGEEEREVARGEKRRKFAAGAEEEVEEEAEVEDVVLASSLKPKPKLVNGKGKAKRTAAVQSDEETYAHELPAKKPRGSQEKTGKGAVRLMTTGVNLTDDVIKRLTKLGVEMTTKPTDCTHLIAKGIIRTEKFLCAMSVSPYILTAEWTNTSAKSGKLLPEEDYLLSDEAGEKKWAFKLADAMARAKGPEGGPNLFKHMTFYLTPKLPVESKLLKNVISAGGGQVQTVTTLTARTLSGKPNRYVVSCEEDKTIWRPLVAAGVRVYSPELVLRAALTQKIEWERSESMVAE